MDCNDHTFYGCFQVAQHIQFKYDQNHLATIPQEQSKVSCLVGLGFSFDEASRCVFDEHVSTVSKKLGKNRGNFINLCDFISKKLMQNDSCFCFGGGEPLPRVIHGKDWVNSGNENDITVGKICEEFFGTAAKEGRDLFKEISNDCNEDRVFYYLGRVSMLLVAQHYTTTKGFTFTTMPVDSHC